MSEDLEQYTRDKGLKGKKFNDVRATLLAQAAQIRSLDGPDHFGTLTLSQPQATSKETTQPIDLRQQTYEILSQLREPTSEEKAALEDRGQVFLPIDTRTYAQVVSETPNHFLRGEVAYAHKYTELREYEMPVAVEVGLNPTELAMPGSFDRSQEDQLAMAEARSQELQKEFPDARVIMLPVTAYAQADYAFNKKTGEVLFKNCYARGLDMLSETDAARAGRDDPSERFDVGELDARLGHQLVGLVPAVVFVKNQELAS